VLIEAVGKNVTQFQPGDEVFGDLSGDRGGFAEYVCGRENALALKPASMTFEQAAAIPQAAMLALQGLRDIGHIQPGQRLLINGAGGGVGTFAIQIANLYGAEVTAVDSPGKLDMLRSIGAKHVIDYIQDDFTKNGQCYDLILDVKTNRSMFDYARALSPDGVYVTVGGSMARLFQALLLGPWIKMISKKNIRIVMLKQNKDLAYMNELFGAGKVKPVIDGPYKLNQVPEAFRHFGEGRHKGKVVITVEQLIGARPPRAAAIRTPGASGLREAGVCGMPRRHASTSSISGIWLLLSKKCSAPRRFAALRYQSRVKFVSTIRAGRSASGKSPITSRTWKPVPSRSAISTTTTSGQRAAISATAVAASSA
jgi:NADPH:quinone reductase-like Zn-dependent oxidoreductase